MPPRCTRLRQSMPCRRLFRLDWWRGARRGACVGATRACGMPNLVLFMADQLRADALGCYDNQFARTPALDGLAAGGARLGAHMTPNQICSPSRGTMFSGLYARHHGLVHNGITLPTDLELIPHALARAGYRTHGIGKFH